MKREPEGTGDETWMEGGVYWEDKENEDRLDVSVEVGALARPDQDQPLSLILRLITGNCVVVFPGIVPKDMIRIGRFLVRMGKEHEER